jgi:hypothetical protein
MSLLIFQITIKQWDKGQSKEPHQSARAAMPTVFSITAEPKYSVFNTSCILEQHGDDIATNVFSNGRIKTSVLSPDRVMFDRFQIVNSLKGFDLEYLANGDLEQSPQALGSLDKGWIQARYTWRYSVLEANQIYWMYEEVTLNAVCVEEFDENCFLKSEPSIVFNDL